MHVIWHFLTEGLRGTQEKKAIPQKRNGPKRMGSEVKSRVVDKLILDLISISIPFCSQSPRARIEKSSLDYSGDLKALAPTRCGNPYPQLCILGSHFIFSMISISGNFFSIEPWKFLPMD
jgi:hypothetical protein